jgi:Holliday junction DNA helicase RuvA
MIAFLSGKLLEKHANTVIVDVGGVGYEVTIPLSTFYELGEAGTNIVLRIYTHVREDAIQLFGFMTFRERDLYLKLISVQGIGAKSGITMLSGMSADEIIAAIRSNDLGRLTTIPGVGRKTAERLVIELRDKVGDLAIAAGVAASRFRSACRRHLRRRFVSIDEPRLSTRSGRASPQTSFSGQRRMTVQKLLSTGLQVLAK